MVSVLHLSESVVYTSIDPIKLYCARLRARIETVQALYSVFTSHYIGGYAVPAHGTGL